MLLVRAVAIVVVVSDTRTVLLKVCFPPGKAESKTSMVTISPAVMVPPTVAIPVAVRYLHHSKGWTS